MAQLAGERESERNGLPNDSYSFRVVASRAARKNMVPADYAAAMMLALRANAPANGRVFHITHSEPASLSTTIDVIAELSHLRRYEIVDSLDGQPLSLPERAFEKVARVFRPYMTESDPVFDTSHSRAVLGEVAFPAIDREYLAWTVNTFFSCMNTSRNERQRRCVK
jgi:hypothetical protein